MREKGTAEVCSELWYLVPAKRKRMRERDVQIVLLVQKAVYLDVRREFLRMIHNMTNLVRETLGNGDCL
jgi:hypothetical protein